MKNLERVHPDAVLNATQAAEVARYLEPAVCDLVALGVNGKQAHWHVRGLLFIPVHEFLDQVVLHAQDAADLIAERVVALGEPLDARLGQVARNTRTPELAEGFVSAENTIKAIVEQIDAVRKTIDIAIQGLESVDPVSQDIVISVAQQLDKDRWFLNSHLI